MNVPAGQEMLFLVSVSTIVAKCQCVSVDIQIAINFVILIAMLYFVPDRLIPQGVSGIRRRYLNECISLTLLLLFGIIMAWFGDDPSNGLLPESWEKIRKSIHSGVMCPLCGGTRSFIFMCRGEIVKAAHYNFFGIVFFFALFIHLFLKIRILISNRKIAFLEKIIAVIDSSKLILPIIFILWAFQWLLHSTGIFLWHTVL